MHVANDARSVWAKVEYRRPFSGVPSVTTLSCTPVFEAYSADLSKRNPSGNSQPRQLKASRLS